MNTSRWIRVPAALALVLGAAGLAGCAFGTRHAELSYPPADHKATSVVATAEAATATVPACCEVILAVRDARANTDRIGNVRNGFGMDTANVVTDDDVRAWVEEAFRHELSGAGYVVLPTGTEPGADNAIRLAADVTKVHCDAYLTYDGEVLMSVEMSRPDMPAFEKSYDGSGSVGLSWAATAKSYAESLSLALQDAVAQVMVDLARYQHP